MLHVVLLVHLCTHGIFHRLLTYAQNDVEIDIITEKSLSYTTHEEVFGIVVAHGTLPLIKVYNAFILVDVLEECRRDIRHALYLMLVKLDENIDNTMVGHIAVLKHVAVVIFLLQTHTLKQKLLLV